MANKEKLNEKLDETWRAFKQSDHDWYAGDVIMDILTIAKEHMSNEGLKKLTKVFDLDEIWNP
jgi:hypothetical protein